MATNAATGPRAIICSTPSERRRLGRALERHRHAAEHHQRRHDKRHRQQHEKGGALHVDEEIAEVLTPGEAARERRQRGDAGRCRHELQPHQRAELREVAQRRLRRNSAAGWCWSVKEAAVLKIRLPSSASLPSGLSGRYCCSARMREAHDKHDHVEDEQRDHVALPVLRGAGDRSADELERPGKLTGCCRCRVRRVHRPFHVAAERPGQERCRADDEARRREWRT